MEATATVIVTGSSTMGVTTVPSANAAPEQISIANASIRDISFFIGLPSFHNMDIFPVRHAPLDISP